MHSREYKITLSEPLVKRGHLAESALRHPQQDRIRYCGDGLGARTTSEFEA